MYRHRLCGRPLLVLASGLFLGGLSAQELKKPGFLGVAVEAGPMDTVVLGTFSPTVPPRMPV